jgi:M6 family metalloprotease-like protein
MLRLPLIVLLSFFCLIQGVKGQYHSVPPSPLPVTVALPDGSSIQLLARGNDFSHWTETLDGYTVVRNQQGFYEYAVLQEGQLQASGIRAYDPAQRNLQQSRRILGLSRHISPTQEDAHQHDLSPLGAQGTELQAAVPSKGQLRLLAICIDYPDLPHTYSTDWMSQMLNEGVNGKPSFRDYFLENSYGQLDLQVDVAGWYTADKNFEYYGDENGKSRARELVQQALRDADDDIDYSNYDNDQDGDVDGVIIIHAGRGAEDGGLRQYIWSHRWTVPFASHDNTFIFDYTIQPETRSASYGGDVGIGIFCHEFGHLLGLPDLYDTDFNNGSSHGIGEWGLMGSGGWLGREDYPAGLSAWSKERLGWIEPQNITSNYGTFSLRPAHAFPDYLRIESGREGEYFLLENRQRDGYDAFLNGEGLAIWHINTDKTSLYPSRNAVNGDENFKGVDLEEADGIFNLDKYQNRGDEGDLYPGESGQQTFNYITSPNSDSYFLDDGSAETGVSLKDISLSEEGIVSFTHSRLFSNSGENCERALIAFEGENQVPQGTGWFEFTMPRDGSLQIDTDEADFPTHALLYLSCDDASPLLEVVSEGAANAGQPLEIKYLPAGQTVLLQWKEAEGATASAFSFDLRVEGQVLAQDSLALLAMYQSLDGVNWDKKQNWLQTPVSGWQGVGVVNGRVVSLEMQQAGLQGALPDAFYDLTALRRLHLSGNEISGLVDERISNLAQLEYLYLYEPQVEASFLPVLSSLSALKVLSLQDVEVNTSLPLDMGELAKLEEISIVNAALSGAIPPSIGNLANLRKIDFSQNRLNETLPPALGSLWKLEHLSADQNLLSGALPQQLLDLPQLKHLSLEENLLTAIPENLLSSNTLTYINLGRNRIQGRLPQTASRSSDKPLHLDVSENALQGTLSELLADIEFSVLDLSRNAFTEQVPPLKVRNFLGLEANRFMSLASLPDINDGDLVVRLARNQFTFDDLLQNAQFIRCASCSRASERYHPQDTLKIEQGLIVREGDPVTYELPHDENISDNRYQWYRNDTLLPSQQSHSLQLTDFDQSLEGVYSCRITNPGLPGLTLIVHGLVLELKAKQEQQIIVAAIGPKTFGDVPFALQASSDAGLPLTYSRLSGPIALLDNMVSLEGAGEAVIKVSQAGNADYHPVEREIRFAIDRAEQQITVQPVDNKTYGDEAFPITATSSSGLPVSLQLSKGNATLSNQLLTIEGAGIIEIVASQAGNGNYLEASPQTIRFEVAKAEQRIAWPEIPDQVFGAAPLNLEAVSSVDLPVSYDLLEGPAVLQDQLLTITGAGTIRLAARQEGNQNYQAAAQVQQTIRIAKASQTIFFNEIFDQEVSEEPLILDAQSDAELPINFTVIEGPARIENGNQLFLEDEGEIVVEASQGGNSNYLAAEAVQRSFYASLPEKLAQNIVVATLPDTVSVTEVLLLQWSLNSSLDPDISIEGPAIRQGQELTFTGSGKVSVIFEQPGNDEYKAAPRVIREIFVKKAVQSITLSSVNDVGLSEQTVELFAESSSGLPVLFRVLEGNVNLLGNTLNLLDSGSVRIEAYQPGDDFYEAAEPQVFSFEVILPELLSQTIEYEDVPDQAYTEDPITLSFSATSGLSPTVIAEGPVSLQGKEMTILGTGEVSIRIFQKGNESYAATDTVFILFDILPAPQTISLSTENLSENRYLLSAEASSGLPVSFEIVSGEAVLDGDTVIISGQEDVVIEATQAGDNLYLPAAAVRQTLINKRITSVPDENPVLLKVYPNPSTDVFYLTFDGAASSLRLSLFDARGRLIKSWSPTAAEAQIELSDQASGVYHLHVEQAEQYDILRLVKQ